ncbi:CBS domain-containing protein [Halocatena marina]|uniref:CBS domain-containing protein n=1 Tax=Halocatena marina TaxID=2934937 RepID=A0ABD5YHI3_9EURY|nr:CBS domain-containing protein [Halocatena marina]
MLKQMSLAEAMRTDVETIESDAVLIEVGRRLRKREIGSVVIVDDGPPVGIVTETDLVEFLVTGGDVETVTAAECMSSPLITIDASSSIIEAATLLREHNIKKLPVLSDGELDGIVTTTDLASYLPQFSVQRTSRERTEGRVPRPNPEMAYDDEGWQFEYRDTTSGTFGVGDVVEFSKVVTDADVRSFAEISGDTNRLHLDSEFAAQTRFDHRIVHGTLVSGLISAALARIPGLTIYLAQDISYLAPVAIGDRITAVCEAAEALGNNKYRLSTDVYDENDERVIEGEAVILLDDLPDIADEATEEG